MRLCNIDSPVEYLNMIENEDQRDERTPQEQIAIDCLDMAARDAMFDELVDQLDEVGRALEKEAGHIYFKTLKYTREMVARARLLQRKE